MSLTTGSILLDRDADPPVPRNSRRRWLLAAVSGLGLAGAVAIAAGEFTAWRRARPLPAGDVEQITSTGATETSPTLSPDGQWIAYRSDEAGTGDIFIRRIGDEQAINLTADLGGDESDPAFSPDGEWIAFRSIRQSGGLFVMRRDGSGLRRLTQFGVTPTWSPDGRIIVFATRAGIAAVSSRGGTSEGWKVDVASVTVSRMTRSDFRHPSVSPGGRRIAYWGYTGSFGTRGFTHARADIWTMRLDGTAPVRVTDDEMMDWSPIWSSDGRYLYFVSNRGGSQSVWRIEIDESTGRTRSVPEAVSALPSAAGSLTRSAGDQRFAWSTFASSRSIYRIPFSADARAVKGEATLVFRSTVPFVSAAPSPDGLTVVLASGAPAEDIYVARADGSGVRALTTGPARDSLPRWAPDNHRIAFESDRDGHTSVWLVNADGTGLRRLTESNRELTAPVWSPDGAKIAVWDRAARRLVIYPVLDGPARSSVASLSVLVSGEFAPSAWSPDGAWIAGTAGGSVSIYSLARRTLERVAPGSSPVWLSDSRRLLYVSEGRIHIAETVWKFTREVMALPGEDLGAPALTHDDTALYFSRPRTDADLWVLTVR